MRLSRYHRPMPLPPEDPIMRGRLVWLRPLEKADLAEVDFDHVEFAHYAGFKAARGSDQDSRWFDELLPQLGQSIFQFVICRLGSREGVGGCGLRDLDRENGSAEASIFLDPGNWGQGLGTDAMAALIDFGFGELRLERIYLHVFDYNPRAIRSYEKVGFVREATLRRARFHRGDHHDVILMAILRDEWLALERPRSWDYAPGS
jgi:RimJ/RimL family protein N-acetyltransferase